MRRNAAAMLAAVALAVATLAVYAPTLGNGFVNYDDTETLIDNARVRNGISIEGLAWSFRINEYPNWHPLTWISHMLDFQLFGTRAGLHHAVNALIHAGNAVLLFALLRGITGSAPPAALAAALFALHPLRVESVAWASERKDVLCAFFGLLALAAYLRHARRRSNGAYAAAVALYAGSLMAKSMLVTFPVLLLLLDYWPLGRWRRGGRGCPSSGRLLAEKAPFAALALVAGVLTLIAQRGAGSMATLMKYPVGERVGNAFRSCGVYLVQTVWPMKLAVFYPNFWQDVPWWQPAAGAVLVVGIGAAAWRVRRRRPALLAGWAWYLVALLPVIGLVQVGAQSHADRYTYLPQIGLFLAVIWSPPGGRALQPRLRLAVAAAAVAIVAVAAALSAAQVTVWRSSQTLFTHAIRVTERNFTAYSNLGNALLAEGRLDEALALFNAAVHAKPNYADGHFNLGTTLMRKARGAEAEGHFRAAILARPSFVEARNNLGLVLLSQGRVGEAVEQFQEALRIKPGDTRARRNLDRALAGWHGR